MKITGSILGKKKSTRLPREEIIKAAKTALIPRWVDEFGLRPVEPVRLKVVAIGTYIRCPYQENAQIPASVCSIGSRTPTNLLCFRCPDGELFDLKSGGRTFKRVVVSGTHPGSQNSMFKVRVSKKKYGIEYTSANLNHAKDEVTMPFYETIVPGTFLTSKEHHGPLPESELASLASKAAHTRLITRRGGSTTPSKRGKKMAGWYDDLKDDNRKKARGGKTTVTVRPGSNVVSINTAKKRIVTDAPKKKPESAPMTTEALISREAKRMSDLAKKGR